MARTLQEWETYITPFFKKVRLLGEIPLNQVEFDNLSEGVRELIKRSKNMPEATRRLTERYPRVFVTFLAHYAAHNIEHDFWDALADFLHIQEVSFHNLRWHTTFMEILETGKKETFGDVGGVTNKYVTSMRLHGGIPAHSLPDFFERMLLPAIERQQYAGLHGKELLDALLNRSEVLFVDSPVINFFENSGDLGVQFLESCLAMAKAYRKEQLIPDKLNLPAYVPQIFVEFIENQIDEQVQLKRPYLVFDEIAGLSLVLHEQPITGSDIEQAFWNVERSNQAEIQKELVHIRSRGRDILTEEKTISIGGPVPHIHVSFHTRSMESGQSQRLRRWAFRIIPSESIPLLVFRQQDNRLVNWSQSLPADTLLLVYPKKIDLQFDGNAPQLHVMDLYDDWDGWQAEYRSLKNAWTVHLMDNGEELSVIPIQEQLPIPEMTGKEPFKWNADPKNIPLYIGTPPCLKIPLRPGRQLSNELGLWTGEISSVWEAIPPINTDFSLADYCDKLIVSDTEITFDLACILGQDAIGTYTLSLHGPLDTEIDFRFRLWGDLSIEDLPNYLLPNVSKESSVPLAFKVSIPVTAICESQTGEDGIRINKKKEGQYLITVDESIIRADLLLAIQKQDGQRVHVPVFIPIPRLEWRLNLGTEDDIKWQTCLLKHSTDSFLQASQNVPISLLVRMAGLDTLIPTVGLQLVDSDAPEHVLQSDFKIESSPLGPGNARSSLNARDTLRSHPEISTFDFQLVFQDPVNKKTASVRLITLTRDIQVSNVKIIDQNGSTYLTWDEPYLLKNRRVYIRSAWQAWGSSYDIKLPDDAQGRFDLLSNGYGLPPSQYEVYFYIAPTWETARTQAPQCTCFKVETVTPQDQLKWLDAQLIKIPKRAFQYHFEKACVYQTMGDKTGRDLEIKACYEQLDQAGLQSLLGFHEWTGIHDPITQKAVRMKMYRVEKILQLIREYEPSNIFRQTYLQYIIKGDVQPDAGLLLIESEDNPLIILYCLRSIIRRHDKRGIDVIVKLLDTGRLTDPIAIDLLALDMDFCIGTLYLNSFSPTQLRLLSALLRRPENQHTSTDNLPPEMLRRLVCAELDIEAAKEYLRILIKRSEESGIDLVMQFFDEGRLPGGEVTELLGCNPKFSYDVLSSHPDEHSHCIQITELVKKYPAETGFIKSGMVVLTPGGWGQINRIEDEQGKVLDVVNPSEKVIYKLTLHPKVHPESAILDMQQELLIFPGVQKAYRCTKCKKFISASQEFITKDHNRQVHSGINAAFSIIHSPIIVVEGPEFKTSIS